MVFDNTFIPRIGLWAKEGFIFFRTKKSLNRSQFFGFETADYLDYPAGKDFSLKVVLSGLALSPDGRWVACSLAEKDSDIMLIENFR